MNDPSKPPKNHGVSRQRGIALLGALVVVAVVALSARTLLDQQTILTTTLQTERDRTQAQWLLRSGLDWAKQRLSQDARRHAITRADGAWAQPITDLRIDIPNRDDVAWLSGRIQDEQGKFNLRELLNTPANGHLINHPALVRTQLEQLLSLLGLPAEWATHFESRLQLAQLEQFYWPAVIDLLPTDAVTPEQRQVLLDHFTLLPASTPLNINTASAAVLSVTIQGLDLATAKLLIQQRERGQWFNSVGDFMNRINIAANPSLRPLDIRSRWFMVQGQVTLEHAARQMLALLYRTDEGVTVIRWIKE